MGVKDALLLNLTGSNFEALQTNDTARIKGDFSIKNTSDVEVFGFDASKSTVTVSGNITSSANISSSLTGSFGRIVAQTYHGDGFAIRDSLPRSVGLITSSAQIASQISGAFEHGFEASASISGSRTVTGSFGRLDGNIFRGDGSGLKTTLPRSPGIVTSSAQLATSISGSFNKGFEYTGTVKGAEVTAGGTWSAGGALAHSITYHAVAGDKSGAISAMGTRGSWPTGYFAVPGGINTDCNEEYNGTNWSEANNNTTARARAAAAGSVNAGLFFGGLTTVWYGASSAATETYDGTNWSEVNDMIIPRRAHLGSGTQNSALAIGGYKDTNHNPTDNPSATPTMDCNVELWNGTNWSNNGQAPAIMKRGAAAGTVNTTLVFGSTSNKTESYEWDGSSWSEGGTHPSRGDVGGGGSSNDAISFGGYPATTEAATYDGSTWSETGNTIVSNGFTGMGANQQAASTAIAVGGQAPAPAGVACTEEYTGGTAIITGSFGRVDAEFLHGDGTNITSSLPFTAGIVSGSAQLASAISGSFNKGFEFSGEITGGNASFGRLDVTSFHGDGSGLKAVLPRTPGLVTGSAQLASAISGSFNKGFEFTGTVQTSPGGTWSAGGNLTRTTYLQAGGMSGTGTKFAGLFIGGRGNAQTEEYDGSSFTERNDLSEVKNQSRMTGTTEAALVFGGSTTFAVEGKLANTEEWNGTNWSEVNNLTNARWTHGKLGITSEAAKAVAGQFSGYPAATDSVEDWNGTNWSEGTDMPVAINSSIVSAGTYDSGIVQGPPSETYCWNGSSWSDVGTISVTRVNRAGGFGTSNDALIAGGCSSPIQYLDCVELFNGTTWSSGPVLPEGRNNMGDADSLNTGTCAGMIAGGVGGTAPHYCNSSLEYSNNISSFTAHQVKGNILKGDGSGLTRELAPGLVSSSAQLATSISGSFNKGFAFGGEISGSRTSTGSFGRVETTNIAGNAKFATGVTLPSGTVSASAQLASSISGSFNKGFEYVGEIAGDFADIVTNGGFDADSDWTQKETGWTISDGKAVASNVGYSYTISQNVSEVQTGVEQTFRATVTISDYSAGTLRFIIGTSFVGISMTANGTFTQEITTTPASQKIGLLGASGTALNCKIDNVKVEILSPALRVATSGSFGRVEADKIFGDATKFKSNLTISSGVVSASAQLASSISGSFNKGFEFGGNLTYTQRLTASYVGVSGSSFAHAGNATTMSISSICGSDFDYRLDDAITAGQIKGTSYGTGVWSNATAMAVGARGRAMAGTQNAFLSAGSYATNNTTTQKFNGSSWSVSAVLNNTGRTAAGVGTQNAMATFGGMNPGYTADDKSELYNGATWSNGNNMGTTRSSAGSAGTQNAAIIYGGIVNSPAIKRTETELYDGNAFTETADLSTGRGFASAGGTQNDAIIAAGLGTSPSYGVCTEIWNGTSWTEVANLNTNRWNTTGIGTANHMVVVTGHAGSTGCSHVEEWNGDSWSEVSEMTTLRAFTGPAAGGLGDQGIYAGGYTYPAQDDEVTTTELWNAGSSATGSFGRLKADFIIGDVTNITQSIIDGTSFLTGSSIIASRISGAFTSGFEISSNIISYCGSGTSLAKSYFTGVSGSTFYNYGGGAISSSYCGSDLDPDLFYSVNNIRCAPIGGVWKASAHMLNITGISHGATGVSDALIVAGGVGKDPTAPHAAFNSTKRSEEFDGTSWSALSDLYGGHTTPNAGGYMGGTVHAAWITAAYNYGAPQNNYTGTENWNGVSWYDSADTNTPRRYGTAQGSGTQNAGIIAGGKCSSLYACTELFNGNVWTEVADLIQASVSHAMVGTQNDAAIAFGDCSTGGGIGVNACAHQGWDGTSWRVLSNPAPQAIGRTAVGGGIPNDSVFTGYQMGAPAVPGGGRVCYFDGTSWSNLGGAFVNARICSHHGGDGNANSLIFTGGCTEGTPDVSTGATEIWTGTTTVTGSFGIIKPRGAGIKTEAFKITSSLFQLPVFNDDKINYVNNEGMQSTGSLSGSVDRVADVIVGQKLGEMWFDEGKNAIGYTYQSRSLISQSLNYGQIFNNDFCSSQPGVYATQSVGYFTQSFFQCTIRTCYLTASLN